MLYLLSYNSEVTTHALGVLSSYNGKFSDCGIWLDALQEIHLSIE